MSRVASGCVVGGQEEQVLGEERLDHEFGVVDRQVDDGCVELPAEHVGHERRRGAFLDDRTNARVIAR